MLRTLYKDVGDICCGGFFTSGYDCMEVIDLDSAAGVDDCVLIERGSIYLDEKGVRAGAECCGETDTAKIDSVVRAVTFLDRHCFGELDKLESRIGPNAINRAMLGIYWAKTYRGLDSSDNFLFVPMTQTDNKNRIWPHYTPEQAEELAKSWGSELEEVENDDMTAEVTKWLIAHDVDLSN